MLYPLYSSQESRGWARSQPCWKILCVTGIHYELNHSHGNSKNLQYIFWSKFGFKHINLCEKSPEKIPLRQQQRLLFQSTFYVNGKKKWIASTHLKIHKRHSHSVINATFVEIDSRHCAKIQTFVCILFFAIKQTPRWEVQCSQPRHRHKDGEVAFTVTPNA